MENEVGFQILAALTLATVGDQVKALRLAAMLKRRFPEDTIVQFNYLPVIYAQVALNDRDPSHAIELLRAASPYELGLAGINSYSTNLYPVYIRGQALLALHQGGAAAAEFQKILRWRGVVLNEPIGALAHLGIARAYALQGETAKAKAAYQEFLTIWKDADTDIPIFKRAQSD